MPVYMIEFAYNSRMVEGLLANPEDRSVAVGNMIQKLGGKMLSFYYCFGDYDGVIIAEMPDNAANAASTIIAYAAGGTNKIKTTVLMTVKEAMDALKKAKDVKLAMPFTKEAEAAL